MQYPGKPVKTGDDRGSVVRAVQEELRRQGFGPFDAAGTFGPNTKAAVMLFQTRTVDRRGTPLKRDGAVGPLTWEALFGSESVPTAVEVADLFLARVLEKALSQVGVRERPRNSNSGPEVDEYLRRAGVPLSLPTRQRPWCCAFTYWCFDESSRAAGRDNPMVKTAGCLDHWNRSQATGARRVLASRAAADPSLVQPGMLFIIDAGRGQGHTGFVERVAGGLLHTMEGNTDASATREGGGVYQLTRKIVDINKGFIDYTGV